MYIVMGYTRGDELIGSTSKPLFASASRQECEAKLQAIIRERDEWLAAHQVPDFQQCAIYARFAIVETAFADAPESQSARDRRLWSAIQQTASATGIVQ